MRPTFYFDEDCPVCRFWTRRWKQSVGDRVVFTTLEQESKSSIFVDADGGRFFGAEGVFEMLAQGSKKCWLKYYRHYPMFAWVSEKVYKLVSKCRTCAWEFTKMIFPSAKNGDNEH